jgi:hypothetical protein
MRLKLGFLLLTMAVSPPSGNAQDELPTISVCDALHNASQYNGKIVALRGYFRPGHGGWINGDCKEQITTVSGLKWPNDIWVLGPRSAAMHALSFDLDERAMEEMRDKLSREIKDRERDRIWVTYIGLFETWDNLKTAEYKDARGNPRLAGFGHLGGSPAQLFIKTAKDVTVEHASGP